MFLSVPANGCITDTITGSYHLSGNASDTNIINTAIITTGSSATFSDTASVTVVESCFDPNYVIIPDSASVDTSGISAYTNDTIFIMGTWFINQDLTLTNCVVYAGMNAHILVIQGFLLTLDHTIITGCETMWRGIEVQYEARIIVEDSSIVADGAPGITIDQDALYFKLYDSYFIDCSIEVYVVPNINSTLNNTFGEVYGCEFGLRNGFKNNYPGQPNHGYFAETDIELNDLVAINIGDPTQKANYFYQSNRGITIRGGGPTRIQNSEFFRIDKDTFYGNNIFDGFAVVALENANHKSSDVIVLALSAASPTIHGCYRGVYSYNSKLEVTNVHIKDVLIGVMSEKCTNSLRTTVSGCTIEATRYGIRWRLNAGASVMLADNNIIKMDGESWANGISIDEGSGGDANYYIVNNQITIIDGRQGIKSNAVELATITGNTIRLQVSSSTRTCYGITLTGNDGALVSCNTVIGNQETDTLMRAINVNSSISNTISCNTSDSTGWGFFFDGNCAGTSLISNTIINHYEGLHITVGGATVISQQSLRGNMWTGSYGSGYGAVNLYSTSPAFVSFNEFEVNDSVAGTIFHPTNYIDPSCTGCTWFVYQPGQQDTCSDSYACDGSSDDESMQSFGQMDMAIAQDSLTAINYEQASISMADQYLYDKADNNDSLRLAETELSTFYNDLVGGEKDYLKRSKDYFKDVFSIDSQERDFIFQLDSLIDTLSAIFYFNSKLIFSGSGNSTIIVQNQQLIVEINQIRSTIDSVYFIYQNRMELIFDSIAITNVLILPSDVIAQNEKDVNELSLLIEGGSSLTQTQMELLGSIAIQCPLAGGLAVYRARPYFELFNDSIQFYDDSTCTQLGYFRHGNSNSSNIKKNKYFVKPNPAYENTTLVYYIYDSKNLQFYITDLTGRNLFSSNLEENVNEYKFSTDNLSPGFYLFKIVSGDAILGKGNFTIMK